jgi:hypothetical protein
MHGVPQSFDSMLAASLRQCCIAATGPLESKFLNHRAESRIPAPSQSASILHKFFMLESRKNHIFKTLGVAMGISG